MSSLAYRPELLLLDEPFSGLDTIVREDLIDALLDLTEQESGLCEFLGLSPGIAAPG